MDRDIIASGSGDHAKGLAMLRNSDRMEGGPGDPRTAREWWSYFKGWPLRVVLSLLAIFLFALVVTVLDQHVYWFHKLFR